MASNDDILAAINSLHDDIHEFTRRQGELTARLDQLVASHNEVGENVAWLTANTQGIFQMFNSPDFMNQMMSSVLGGQNGGQRQPAATEQPAE